MFDRRAIPITLQDANNGKCRTEKLSIIRDRNDN